MAYPNTPRLWLGGGLYFSFYFLLQFLNSLKTRRDKIKFDLLCFRERLRDDAADTSDRSAAGAVLR